MRPRLSAWTFESAVAAASGWPGDAPNSSRCSNIDVALDRDLTREHRDHPANFRGMTTLGAYGRVFCLEGDWDGELTSRSSVRPMLELLEGLKRIEYVHKDVGTRAELRHYLRRWLDHDPSVSDYGTLYLAF